VLVYLGYFEGSFPLLHAKQDRYWRKNDNPDEHPGLPVEVPPKHLSGIRFGFMQTAGGFCFVRIDDLVLRAPVLFIGGRHGPAAPGPAWSELNDDVAAQVLVDSIIANPEYRDALGDSIRKLEPRR
jgi:hypothetical protein